MSVAELEAREVSFEQSGGGGLWADAWLRLRRNPGAILTETVFAFPGIGTWLQMAIVNRDYPVIQGGILFVAIIVVLVNLIVDLSYGLLNPRIRLAGR